MRRTQAEVSYLSTITIESEENLGKDGIGWRFLCKERDSNSGSYTSSCYHVYNGGQFSVVVVLMTMMLVTMVLVTMMLVTMMLVTMVLVVIVLVEVRATLSTTVSSSSQRAYNCWLPPISVRIQLLASPNLSAHTIAGLP